MAEPTDPDDIRNWQRRPDGVTTSGKLNPGDPARLAAIGIKHVVNLALDDHPEALQDEGVLLAREGVVYTHIPVPFDAPTHRYIQQMSDALREVAGPAHVHCIMNYRVTAFFYVLDRKRGVPEDEARALMQQVWDPLASDLPAAEPWRILLTP